MSPMSAAAPPRRAEWAPPTRERRLAGLKIWTGRRPRGAGIDCLVLSIGVGGRVNE